MIRKDPHDKGDVLDQLAELRRRVRDLEQRPFPLAGGDRGGGGDSTLIVMEPLVTFPQDLDGTPLALGTLTLPTKGLYTAQWGFTAGDAGAGENITVSASADSALYFAWVSSLPNPDFAIPGVDGIWTDSDIPETSPRVGDIQAIWVVSAPVVFTVYGYITPFGTSGGIADLQFSAMPAGPSQVA